MRNFKEEPELNVLNHSCAHLLAQAVKHLFPEAKFWVGPVVETGFYYDVDLGDKVVIRKYDSLEEERDYTEDIFGKDSKASIKDDNLVIEPTGEYPKESESSEKNDGTGLEKDEIENIDTKDEQ